MKPKRSEAYQGSYGKFLETLKSPGEEGDKALTLSILRPLAAEGSPLSVRSLLEKTGLPPLQLARTIETMKAQELITVTAVSGDDMVELTPTGLTLAKLEASR